MQLYVEDHPEKELLAYVQAQTANWMNFACVTYFMHHGLHVSCRQQELFRQNMRKLTQYLRGHASCTIPERRHRSRLLGGFVTRVKIDEYICVDEYPIVRWLHRDRI